MRQTTVIGSKHQAFQALPTTKTRKQLCPTATSPLRQSCKGGRPQGRAVAVPTWLFWKKAGRWLLHSVSAWEATLHPAMKALSPSATPGLPVMYQPPGSLSANERPVTSAGTMCSALGTANQRTAGHHGQEHRATHGALCSFASPLRPQTFLVPVSLSILSCCTLHYCPQPETFLNHF